MLRAQPVQAERVFFCLAFRPAQQPAFGQAVPAPTPPAQQRDRQPERPEQHQHAVYPERRGKHLGLRQQPRYTVLGPLQRMLRGVAGRVRVLHGRLPQQALVCRVVQIGEPHGDEQGQGELYAVEAEPALARVRLIL